MAIVSIMFSLLIISKQLYLSKNRAVWSLVMVGAFAFSTINVVVAFVNLFLTRVTKFEGFVPIKKNPKGLQLYIKIEARIVCVLMAICLLSFRLYAHGADFSTFQGDHWWIETTSLSALLCWLSGLLRTIQLITWDCSLRIRQ